MSAIEFCSPSKTFGVDITLVAGNATTAKLTNFLRGVSKVIGVVSKVAGGTPGSPSVGTITPSVAGAAIGCTVALNSTNALDTSTYTLYWTNEVGSGLLPA